MECFFHLLGINHWAVINDNPHFSVKIQTDQVTYKILLFLLIQVCLHTEEKKMTSPQTTPAEPKKKNCFLWGCLIVLMLFIVICCCLGSLMAMPFVTDFNPLGLDWQNRILEVIPWEDFIQDPSLIPGLPDILNEDFDSFFEEVDPSSDYTTLDSGSFQLVPYTAIDFPIAFSYPAGWEIEAEELHIAVSFYDPDSNTFLSVGRDWACQGCSTAADTSVKLMETLEFQAQEGTFMVIENAPYSVSSGEDAYFNAFEWIDLDGIYRWAYDINIFVEEDNIYFIMWGDDPVYFEMYGELIEEIGASYRR
jgi:hypothetical protein